MRKETFTHSNQSAINLINSKFRTMQECSAGHKQSSIQLCIAPFVSSHVGDDACRHWIDAQYQRQAHCSFSLFFWHRPQLKDRPRRQQPNCNILVFRPRVQLLTPRIHQVGSYDRIAKGRISTKNDLPSTAKTATVWSFWDEQSVARHCSHFYDWTMLSNVLRLPS